MHIQQLNTHLYVETIHLPIDFSYTYFVKGHTELLGYSAEKKRSW